MISIIWGGEAFSTNVAAAPKRSGNTARPPSPKVKAKGGDPTLITPERATHLLADIH
jgi:hypothetical protein